MEATEGESEGVFSSRFDARLEIRGRKIASRVLTGLTQLSLAARKMANHFPTHLTCGWRHGAGKPVRKMANCFPTHLTRGWRHGAGKPVRKMANCFPTHLTRGWRHGAGKQRAVFSRARRAAGPENNEPCSHGLDARLGQHGFDARLSLADAETANRFPRI